MNNKEKQLWDAYWLTPNDATRNALVVKYLGVVGSALNGMKRNLPHRADFDDLYQAGAIGLMNAIGKFDPTRNVAATTYMLHRVRGSMLDHLREDDTIPRLVRKRHRLWSEARETLNTSLGREPMDDEIAEYLGLSAEKAEVIKRDANVIATISLERIICGEHDNKNINMGDSLVDEKFGQPGEAMERTELVQYILQSIPPGWAIILVHHFLQGKTMDTMSGELDLSASRISQLMSKIVAYAKLSSCRGAA